MDQLQPVPLNLYGGFQPSQYGLPPVAPPPAAPAPAPAAPGVKVDQIGAGGVGTTAATPASQHPVHQPIQAAPAPTDNESFATKALKAANEHWRDEAAKADAIPKPPELQLPQLQPTQPTSPLQVWGSAAMAFAALGSLFTRQPMTTALNAAAGVMNAYRQGDTEAAQAAYQNWKASTDYAIKLAEYQDKRYSEQLELAKTDADTAYKGVEVLATQFQHQQMYQLAVQRNGIEMQRYLLDMNKFAHTMEAQAPLIELMKDKLRVATNLNTAQAALNAATTPDAKAVAQKQYDAAVQDAHNFAISQGKSGGQPTPAQAAKQQKDAALYKSATAEVDKALAMLSPEMVGTRGWINRKYEGVKGQIDPSTPAPARKFASQIASVEFQVRNLIAKSHYMSTGAQGQIEELVGGMDRLSTYDDVRRSLQNIKSILADQSGKLSEPSDSEESGTDVSAMSDDAIMQQLGILGQ